MHRLIIALHRHRLRFGLLLALLATLTVGAFATTRAQGQQCRDFDNVTVCYDTMYEEGGIRYYEGNLKVGYKGAPPLVGVHDISDPSPIPGYEKAQLIELQPDPEFAKSFNIILVGEISMLGDITAEPLMASTFIRKPGLPDNLIGAFFIETEFAEISPASPIRNPLLRGYMDQLEPNDGFDYRFIADAGLTRFEPLIPDSLAVFYLEERVFVGDVRLFGENPIPGVGPVYAKVTVSETGSFKKDVPSFSGTIAGMTARFMDVELLDPFADDPALRADGAMLAQADADQGGLKIGTIEFRKEDNPSLPNLDARDPGLVFKVEGVEYRNKRFQIRGTVPIRDWQVGNAFSLTNQQLSLGFSQVTNSYDLTISSTMTFTSIGSAVSDTTRYPVALTIGAQQVGEETLPLFKGTLGAAQPNLGIGMLRIKPQGIGLEFNPARNFYGLVAEKVSIQWNSQGGGASGPSLQGFRLGVDRDKNLIFNLGAGGDFELPAFRSSVLTGKLTGSFSVKDNVLTGNFNGTMAVALPGNSGAAPTVTLTLRRGKGVRTSCPDNSTPETCLATYDMRLSAFEVKLAGFTMALANPRGLDGGGIAASQVTLKMPPGLSFVGGAGVQVRGLRIAGNGSVSIDGGGFELPPIKAGGYEFTSVKGFFAKTATEYEFRAGATLPLPGMSSSGGRQIKADMAFRTRPNGSFLGAGVKLNFTSSAPGIPLGTTGMELMRLGGSFDTGSGVTKIGVTLRAESSKRLRNIPVATVDGQATLQVRPFALTANAKLSLLVVQVAEASIGIGAGQGFNGGNGFYAQVTIDVKVARGEFLVRMGNLTLNNGRTRFSVAISATIDVGIKKHQFFKYVPPFNVNVAQLQVRGGDFKVKGGGEALGVIGTVSCCRGWLSFSFLVDLGTGDVDSIDPDDYTLYGGAQVRANAAAGVTGFAARELSAAALAAERGVSVQTLLGDNLAAGVSSADTPLLDDAHLLESHTIPFTLEQAGTALFGINYPAGNPLLTLEGPNGLRLVGSLIPANAPNALYLNEGNPTEGFDRAIVVNDAPAGQYRLLIDNAPAEYEQVSYRINRAPQIVESRFLCSNFDASPQVTTTCNAQPSGDSVQVDFRISDPDGPQTAAYVGYLPVNPDGSALEGAQVRIVQEDLPVNGSLQTTYISTTGVPSGHYRMVLGVRDGANAVVEQLSPMTVQVVDRQPPETLRDLLADSAPGAVLVRWEPSPWMDVAGYEVGFGATNDPAAFTYVRDLGALGPDDLDDSGLFSATLWGVGENESVYVSARVYDQDGNKSAWVTPVRGDSWALAPNGQSPLPGGVAVPTSSIQLMFGSPLTAGTLNQRLELLDADGKIVQGTPELISDPATGKLFGMRFVPNAPLSVGKTYEVVLKAGVLSEDLRGMPQDYRWTFTVVAADATGMVPPEPVGALPPPDEGGVPGNLPGMPTPNDGTRIFLPLLRR